jgi:Zn-dependent protease with chaperone function
MVDETATRPRTNPTPEETVICPQCSATIASPRGFVTWCPHCEWNVDPVERDEPSGMLARIRARLGSRLSAQLHESLLSAPTLAPRITTSKALAYCAAGLVHASTAGLVAAGVLLPVLAWPNVVAMAGGLLALGIAWTLRPRLGKAPSTILDRTRHPHIYAVADRISRELGAAPVDGIAINETFNAMYCRVGFRRRQYVTIGLPLFAILDERERVALLAHEVAHGVNGDSTRGLVVGSAVSSLATWHHLWAPQSIASSESGLPGILMIPFNAVLFLFAGAAYGAAYLLELLMYRDSQRAEYLADTLESAVAGSAAAMSMLRKVHHGETFKFAVQRVALNRDLPTLVVELRHQVARVPDGELERIERVLRINGRSLDATHPPTAFRIEMQRKHYVPEPKVTITPEENLAIEKELAAWYARMSALATEAYVASLYTRYA